MIVLTFLELHKAKFMFCCLGDGAVWSSNFLSCVIFDKSTLNLKEFAIDFDSVSNFNAFSAAAFSAAITAAFWSDTNGHGRL